MSGLLGKKHSSNPVTPDDKAMSERHLAHRRQMESASPTVANLRKSIDYNEAHAKEHEKAAKEREKELKKAMKDGKK